MRSNVYRYGVGHYISRYFAWGAFESVMLLFIVVLNHRHDRFGLVVTATMALGFGGAWLALLQFTLATIVTSQTEIIARAFGVDWKRYDWSSVSHIKKVRYYRYKVRENTKPDHQQYFIVRGPKERPFPISFFSTIEDINQLLDFINGIQETYGLQFRELSLLVGQPWNIEQGIAS
jgi:hypothetical protein